MNDQPEQEFLPENIINSDIQKLTRTSKAGNTF